MHSEMTAVPMSRSLESDSGKDELLLTKNHAGIVGTFRSGERAYHLFESEAAAKAAGCARYASTPWFEVDSVPEHWIKIQ